MLTEGLTMVLRPDPQRGQMARSDPLHKGWTGIHVRFGLQSFDACVSTVENAVAAEWLELKRRLEAQQKTLSPEARAEFIEWELDNISQARDETPNKLRSALFVALVAFAEFELYSICRALARQRRLEVPKASRGSFGIESSIGYLRGCGLKLPKKLEDIQSIQRFTELRNCIVHHDGRVRAAEPKNDALRRFLPGRRFVSLDNHERVRFRAGFLPQAVRVVERVFRRVVAGLERPL